MEQDEFERALDLLEKAQIPAMTLIARVVIILIKKNIIELKDIPFLVNRDD